MKNLVLSLVMVVGFITVSTAQHQHKEVVKETTTMEVKKDEAKSEKSCCADKKGEKHAACDMKKHEGHAKTDGMKCCAEKSDKMNGEHDMKKHEGHAAMGEMKCEPNCTKPCCADKKAEVKKADVKVKETAKMAYACPMKCEGDKTYDKEGKCPKCNMNLVPVKG